MIGFERASKFNAEIAIHFPGCAGLNKPHVWVFPELFVCLNCGKSEFTIVEGELRLLRKGAAAAGGCISGAGDRAAVRGADYIALRKHRRNSAQGSIIRWPRFPIRSASLDRPKFP